MSGWLQELPKPMTKLTWDNAVLIGPKMAERLQIKVEDVVELELNGKKITGPVWIQAGHPDNSVTVTLGYGRLRAAHYFRPVDRHRPANPQDRRNLQARIHAGLPKHGHARWRPSSAGARDHA